MVKIEGIYLNKEFRDFLEKQGYQIVIYNSKNKDIFCIEPIYSLSFSDGVVATMDINDGRFTYFYKKVRYTESQIIRFMKLQAFI